MGADNNQERGDRPAAEPGPWLRDGRRRYGKSDKNQRGGERIMDWTTLAVAGMSLVGTLAGTFGGILVSNKLTTYRIEQLEKRVAAHNSLVERTYKLEGRMQEAEHDIRDLKAARKS